MSDITPKSAAAYAADVTSNQHALFEITLDDVLDRLVTTAATYGREITDEDKQRLIDVVLENRYDIRSRILDSFDAQSACDNGWGVALDNAIEDVEEVREVWEALVEGAEEDSDA
jgi:hypothetical protein